MWYLFFCECFLCDSRTPHILLVIGCATKEQQPAAARAEKTDVEKYGTGMFSVGRSGGKLRYTDHVNVAASEEFR